MIKISEANLNFGQEDCWKINAINVWKVVTE